MNRGKSYIPAGAVKKYLGATVTPRPDRNDVLARRGEAELNIPLRYNASGDVAFTRNGITYLPVKMVI